MRVLIASMILAGAAMAADEGFVSLFDGKTLAGWQLVGGLVPGCRSHCYTEQHAISTFPTARTAHAPHQNTGPPPDRALSLCPPKGLRYPVHLPA